MGRMNLLFSLFSYSHPDLCSRFDSGMDVVSPHMLRSYHLPCPLSWLLLQLSSYRVKTGHGVRFWDPGANALQIRIAGGCPGLRRLWDFTQCILLWLARTAMFNESSILGIYMFQEGSAPKHVHFLETCWCLLSLSLSSLVELGGGAAFPTCPGLI